MSEPLPELDESTFDSVLCVVAHPDDIEYGLAAAVAKWTAAGKAVNYFLLTRGEAGIDSMDPAETGPLREAEERASAAVVGVDRVEFGEQADGAIVYGLGLRREIAAAIRRHRPGLVITLTRTETFAGGGLNQADHRAVGLATLDAVADAGNRWIFTELAEDGLQPWSASWVAFASAPESTHVVDVSGYFDAAVASLAEHRAYLEGLGGQAPDPAELLQGILGGAAERAPGAEHALLLEAHQL